MTSSALTADYPISCRADEAKATVLSLTGFDTPRAVMTGRHTAADALDQCTQMAGEDRELSPIALRSCVERFMENEGRDEHRSEANCQAGVIRLFGPGGAVTYRTPIKSDCASGGLTAIVLFRMMCPSYRGKVEEELR